MFSHVPVMPNEAVDALDIRPDGIYVDGTLGGGGHSELILDKLSSGRLIGIDRDSEAISAAKERLSERECFTAVKGNFADMPRILEEQKIFHVNGILLDLGVSSHQISTARRGFSFNADGPLDMRMDISLTHSAYDIVNTYAERALADIFFRFGEERNARRIARGIIKARENSPIETTLRLASVITEASPPRRGKAPHPAMRSFMALRIAVNNELAPLDAAISEMVKLLTCGGRIAVITFHSLEDRIVKNTFRRHVSPCTCPREIPSCVCGNRQTLMLINRKPITPSKAELETNTRSRSAKLRIAEKVQV